MFVRIGIIVLMCTGCGVPLNRMHAGEDYDLGNGARPEWVDRPFIMDKGQVKGFVGTSQDLASEGAARSDALANARQQILDSVGVWGRREVQRVIQQRSEDWGVSVPQVRSDDVGSLISEGEVRSRAREFHIEKVARNAGGRVKYYYKIFVLVLVRGDDAKSWIKDAMRKKLEQQPPPAGADPKQSKAAIMAALDEMQAPENSEW